jgi:hypothetical protein
MKGPLEIPGLDGRILIELILKKKDSGILPGSSGSG